MTRGSAKVQNQLTSEVLQGFERPVSVVMINKAQDWQTRQRVAYESMKGLLKEDFLGLKDWNEQITLYSSANPMYLRGPHSVIKPLLTRNRNVLMQLANHPQLGWVGRLLVSIYGFAKVFVAPTEILNDSEDLKTRLGL